MDITAEPEPSIWYLLGFSIALTAMGIASLYFAINILMTMLAEISNQAEFITIEKGVYYLFGIGAFFLQYTVWLIYIKIFNNKISRTLSIIITWSIVGTLALMFVLPQIIHYSVANNLENQNYQICKERSRRWLHNVTIDYTKTLPCTVEKQLISNDKRIY